VALRPTPRLSTGPAFGLLGGAPLLRSTTYGAGPIPAHSVWSGGSSERLKCRSGSVTLARGSARPLGLFVSWRMRGLWGSH